MTKAEKSNEMGKLIKMQECFSDLLKNLLQSVVVSKWAIYKRRWNILGEKGV